MRIAPSHSAPGVAIGRSRAHLRAGTSPCRSRRTASRNRDDPCSVLPGTCGFDAPRRTTRRGPGHVIGRFINSVLVLNAFRHQRAAGSIGTASRRGAVRSTPLGINEDGTDNIKNPPSMTDGALVRNRVSNRGPWTDGAAVAAGLPASLWTTAYSSGLATDWSRAAIPSNRALERPGGFGRGLDHDLPGRRLATDLELREQLADAHRRRTRHAIHPRMGGWTRTVAIRSSLRCRRRRRGPGFRCG